MAAIPPKVVSGARAVVYVTNPNSGAGGQTAPGSGPASVPLGIFNNFSYQVTYDVAPAFILGRFSAAELDYTAVEPVTCSATGWRSMGHGPYADGNVPMVQDLLFADYLEFVVKDRQTGNTIAHITNARSTGFSSSVAARQLQEQSFNYIGLVFDDDTSSPLGGNLESPGAVDLP